MVEAFSFQKFTVFDLGDFARDCMFLFFQKLSKLYEIERWNFFHSSNESEEKGQATSQNSIVKVKTHGDKRLLLAK